MRSDGTGWPLGRALDTVGLVLLGTVVIRGLGGVLAGAGVSSFHINLGATSGTGVVLHGGVPLPTSVRVEYGTSWADMVSGLALLGAIAVIVLPRMVWDLPGTGRRSRLAAKSVTGIGVMAVLTAIGAAIGTVNWTLNVNHLAGPAEAVNVAAGAAAVALGVLGAALSWFALPYLVEGDEVPEAGHQPHGG